jgi:outer membrane protein insertion porin family
MKLGLVLLLIATPAFADEATETSIEESAREPADRSGPEAGAQVPRARTGYFSVGAGVSPDDGFTAHAAVVQDDLFRTGQRLGLWAELSAIRQRFVLAHEAPDLLGSGLDLRSELFSNRRTYPGFTREGTGGAVTLGKRLSRATRLYARYRLEHVAMDPAAASSTDPAAAARMETPAPSLGEGILATLGAGLEYDTLDAPALPRRGSRLELFAERADRRLGSDHELLRAGGRVLHARPLGPFTLRLHGHATAVRSRDPMGVPLAFRLQHEGHAAVRGYALEQGNLLGDNVEAVGKVELELPIVPRWGLSLAGFADAGLRYNTDAAWGARNALLQRSAGVSLIWRSPLGPLRFDWAFPLDGERRDRQFLFSLGGAL